MAKRYRFTGKERDEESGLNYHGARYYALWLCRWISVDPLESKYAPQSPYVYCSGNPINRVNLSGMGDDPPAPKDITGQAVKYTDIYNYYDADGNLSYSSTSTSTEEIPLRPHGEYIHNSYQHLKAEAVTGKDGNIAYVNAYDYTYTNAFTPYAAEGSIAPTLWEISKMYDPVGAGILNGAWNFTKDGVDGLLGVAANPTGAALDALEFSYAAVTMPGPLHGLGSEEGRRLASGIAGTVDKFQNGDVYTKSSMTTYGGLTLLGLFIDSESGILSEAKSIRSHCYIKKWAGYIC